jgi:GT2 family glycosyltransferase
LPSGEDFDFAWRAQLVGEHVGFSPSAIVHWRLQHGRTYWNRAVLYGYADVLLYQRFKDRGLRRRLGRGILRLLIATVGFPLLALRSHRYAWLQLAGVEAGRLRGSWTMNTIFL